MAGNREQLAVPGSGMAERNGARRRYRPPAAAEDLSCGWMSASGVSSHVTRTEDVEET